MPDELLFRPEVMKAKRTAWLGEIVIATPWSSGVLAALALAFTGSLFLFLFLAGYSRHESVVGQLVEAHRQISVTAKNAGIVSRILVHEGQVIRKGEPLIEMHKASDHPTFSHNDSIAVLRAPADGTVATIFLTEGQFISVGQITLLEESPDASFHVLLSVPAHIARAVKVGDVVTLRYREFPYQNFGLQYGHIASVARDTSNARQATAEIGLDDPNPLREPSYSVIVSIDRQYIPTPDGNAPLLAGMIVDTDLCTERKRLIAWVTAPLSSQVSHAGASNG